MMHDKTDLSAQPCVELYLNGQIFSGWTSVSIFRSLENMSGSFELGIAIRPEDDVSLLTVGAPAVVKINGQTVISGYLDELSQTISAENKEIQASGRDKTADLIDCSVLHTSYQFKNQSLQQIADILCQPFAIQVIWQVTSLAAAEKIPVWQVEPGESVFDTLSKAARHKGVLITSDVEGNLIFTETSKTQAGNLVLGENLLSLECNDSWKQRYSLYRIIGDNEQGGKKGNVSKNAEEYIPTTD